eukprot:3650-Eustigmatos_ZCMA.PRE.1
MNTASRLDIGLIQRQQARMKRRSQRGGSARLGCASEPGREGSTQIRKPIRGLTLAYDVQITSD